MQGPVWISWSVIENDASLSLQSENGGTDRETTTAVAGLREQLGHEDLASEEYGSEGGDWCANVLDGEIGKKPIEVGWTLGVDGGRENDKESR